MRASQSAALRWLAGGLVSLALGGAAAGCERVDHEHIDKWMSTENGVDKLRSALRSSEHDPDLRAHAAQNLILHPEGMFAEVKDSFDDMDAGEQHAVMAKLAPRLWETAQQGLKSEMQEPSPVNAHAKDALFELRPYADEATRKKIDGYLVDWLTVFYEGRAGVGRVSGRTIIREVGRLAAPKLVEQGRSMLARPPSAEGERLKLGDELLAALAWSGDPEAAGLLIDMATKDYKDESLPKRAIGALHQAYVEPISGQPIAARDALLPHIDRLGEIAKDDNLPGVMNNDAVDLIASIGPPECVPPFVAMTTMPAIDFRYTGIQHGLRCGGAQAVVPIVEAILPTIAYERAMLEKYIWKEILAAPGATKVAEQVRRLLSSKSWVARVTAVEVLAQMANPQSAAADAKRIRQLAGDRMVLKGWWGKQKDVPPAQKKRDPTLGQLATEAAARLEGLAKGSQTK